MSLATLGQVMASSLAAGRAAAGLVCLGWEDARAYTQAAEAAGVAVVLQAGPGARAHTPLPVLAAMLRHLAEGAGVPVAVHLDHGSSAEECRAAIGEGFSSVMFDGSALPFEENVARTAAIAAEARRAGVSCEGEIGVVGYEGDKASEGTDPAEAARFAALTGVDALAVSVGNVHLQRGAGAGLDEHRLAAIAAAVAVPLVIHGGSGVPLGQRRVLASRFHVGKVNIGTELRQAFGTALRTALAADPDAFDRIALLRATEAPVRDAARAAIASLGPA